MVILFQRLLGGSSTDSRGGKRRRKKYRHSGHHKGRGGVDAVGGRRSARHRWVSKGYTECSRSCGGGEKLLRDRIS